MFLGVINMSHCPFCKKKIAMSKAFCSRGCKENYFQLIAIQIPKPFMKRIFVFCKNKNRNNHYKISLIPFEFGADNTPLISSCSIIFAERL